MLPKIHALVSRTHRRFSETKDETIDISLPEVNACQGCINMGPTKTGWDDDHDLVQDKPTGSLDLHYTRSFRRYSV